MANPDNDDIFDDFMSSLGMSSDVLETPATSEEVLYQILGGPKFDNMAYLIENDINQWHYMQEKGIKYTKRTLDAGQIANKNITQLEYARLLIEFYFLVYHLTRFTTKFRYEGQEYPPCDMQATITLFIERNEKLRKIVNKKGDQPVDYDN